MKKLYLIVCLLVLNVIAFAQCTTTFTDSLYFNDVKGFNKLIWPDSISSTGAVLGYGYGVGVKPSSYNPEICQIFSVPQFDKWTTKKILVDVGVINKASATGSKLKVSIMKVDTTYKYCPFGNCIFARGPRPSTSAGAVIASTEVAYKDIVANDASGYKLTEAIFPNDITFNGLDTFAVVLNFTDFYHDTLKWDTIAIMTSSKGSGLAIQNNNSFTLTRFWASMKKPPVWIWIETNESLKNSDFVFCIYPVIERKCTGVEELNSKFGVKLSQNQPNPASGNTLIEYNIVKNANVRLDVLDLTGKVIMSYNEGNKLAGNNIININVNNLAKGIYFYTLNVDNYKITKKLIVN